MKFIYLFSAIFCFFAWLLPNHYLPWLAAYQDFSIFAAALLVLVSLISKKKIQLPLTSLFFFLLVFIPLLQYLFGLIYFLGDAITASIYLSGLAIIFIFGFNIARSESINMEKVLFYFFLLIIFSSLISIWIMLRQWLIFTGNIWTVDMTPNGRPFANLAQPNNCATFLCIGLMASLYLYEKSWINKFCGILLASFILFAIALTQSRTVWVFILAFLVWWFWKTAYFQTRLSKWSVFYFFAIYSIFIIALPHISTHLGVVNTSDILTRATTGYLRIPMWHQMLVAIKNEPLWGYGWNQVSVAQLTVYLDYPTTEWIEHSHNILLDLLIWNGIPIGLLIIAFLVWWLYRLSMLATSIEPFIALSMVGMVLVHAMLEFPLEYAFFLLPVGFFIRACTGGR